MPCTPRQVEKFRNHSAQPTTVARRPRRRGRTARACGAEQRGVQLLGGQLAAGRLALVVGQLVHQPDDGRHVGRPDLADAHPAAPAGVQVDPVQPRHAALVAQHRPATAGSIAKRTPSVAGSPIQRAISTRLKCPCPTSTTSPPAAPPGPRPARRRPGCRPASPVSPPGQGCVHTVQPGIRSRICGGGEALVVAVVPLGEPLVDAVDAQAGQLGGVLRPPARAAQHQRGRAGRRAGARRARRRPSRAPRPRSVSGMSVRPGVPAGRATTRSRRGATGTPGHRPSAATLGCTPGRRPAASLSRARSRRPVTETAPTAAARPIAGVFT